MKKETTPFSLSPSTPTRCGFLEVSVVHHARLGHAIALPFLSGHALLLWVCFNTRLCLSMSQDDKARGELVVFALDSGAPVILFEIGAPFVLFLNGKVLCVTERELRTPWLCVCSIGRLCSSA